MSNIKVLTLNVNAFQKFDKDSPANLFCMWSIFSRCANSLENGRRLENLSWRLWKRDQLETRQNAVDCLLELARLPASVDSLIDEKGEFLSKSASSDMFRSGMNRLNSTTGTRSRHIGSETLVKLIPAIVNDATSVAASTLPAHTPKTTLTPLPALAEGSFKVTVPEPEDVRQIAPGGCCPGPRTTAMLQLGWPHGVGSCQEMQAQPPIFKKMRQAHSVVQTGRNAELRTQSPDDSETDVDDADNRTIYDESVWESSTDDSAESCFDEEVFQRVESKNFVHRPSLITLMVAQNERQEEPRSQDSHSRLAAMESRAGQIRGAPVVTASPDDVDEGELMMDRMPPSNLKPIFEAPRSAARTIPARPNLVYAQATLSPRATRRTMLAAEVTESLRRHLLWERQQKTSTANAVLKRRHTSHHVANLEHAGASHWNQYFDSYHSRGW